jgi:hypothetical protein
VISGLSRFEQIRSDASHRGDQRSRGRLRHPPTARPVRRDRSLAPAQHPDGLPPARLGSDSSPHDPDV